MLVLGATGVTGQLAVQAARRHGAGRVVAAGRNPVVLEKMAKRGTGIISLDQDDAALADAFAAAAGERAFDVVADYPWGPPAEILLNALDRQDAETRSGRTRLVQAGEMAGSQITLPASVLRSAGLEILGVGTGTMPPREPPMEQITAMLTDLRDGLASGEVTVDCERVPLADVADVRAQDQKGRRPVFIP